MKTELTPNNTLTAFYFFDFLKRISHTLAPFQLTAVDLVEDHICLYQKESGCRFLVPLEELMYINETTAQWMADYILPCPSRPYIVTVAQSGQLYDVPQK